MWFFTGDEGPNRLSTRTGRFTWSSRAGDPATGPIPPGEAVTDLLVDPAIPTARFYGTVGAVWLVRSLRAATPDTEFR